MFAANIATFASCAVSAMDLWNYHWVDTNFDWRVGCRWAQVLGGLRSSGIIAPLELL